MAVNTASYVSAGKPSTAGAIWTGSTSATLPTDTSTSIDTSVFTCLGYCSEDGLTNATEIETSEIKAWGGDTVLTIQTSKDDKFSFTLVQTTDVDVLSFVHGSGNVSGTLSTGITVTVNSDEVDEQALIIDMIMRDNTAKRIVIPDCKISEIGEVVYNDSEAVGYEITVTCMPDSSGNTHYEYLLSSASA